MAARNITRVEVLVNETLAGVMDIETDGLSAREHVSFTYADSGQITSGPGGDPMEGDVSWSQETSSARLLSEQGSRACNDGVHSKRYGPAPADNAAGHG